MNTHAEDATPKDEAEAQSADSESAAESPNNSFDDTPSDVDGSASGTGDADPKPADSTEGLPEWEPLTPELVEEEAIRGDFMLRWAVVLLGLLYGFTQIGETQSLVHIKSGLYQLEHGFLPPGEDVFSYTAEGRPWVQLSWLFDLIMGAVYQAGGFVAVGVLRGVIVAVLMWLMVHISRPKLPTWWGSICGAALLVGIGTQLTALPELITLLGLVVLFHLLHKRQHSENEKLPWQIPVLFLVWCNMDPRMFVGLAALLLYGIGDYVGQVLGMSRQTEEQRKQLWIAIGASCVAVLLNPFGWNSLLAAHSLYAVEYPELQQHLAARTAYLWTLPLTDARYWQLIDLHAIVALSLVGVCVAMFILNAKQLDMGHVLVVLGLGGLAVLGSHELAGLAVVAAIFAGLGGQDVYVDNFRQTYSLAKSELIFSRAGRAVTVLGFMGIAYLLISGELLGPNARRIGFGLDPSLQTAIRATEDDMEKFGGERPFNFNMFHGDVLLWAGEKPFIDSRIALFANGEENIAVIHRETRKALRSATYDTSVWQQTVDKFEVTSLAPRLFGVQDGLPDYVTTYDLLSKPDDWRVAHFGAGTILFARTKATDSIDSQDEGLTGIIEEAFRGDSKDVLSVRAAWPRGPTFYERYFTQPQTPITANLLRSRHMSMLAGVIAQVRASTTVQQQLAMLYIAVRSANQTLAVEPQSYEAYFILGNAYSQLAETEFAISQQQRGGVYSPTLRFRLAVSAYWQAVQIRPDSSQVWWKLYELYSRLDNRELARDALVNFERIAAKEKPELHAFAAPTEERAHALEVLSTYMEDASKQVSALLAAEGSNQLQIAAQAWTEAKCTRISLGIIEESMENVEQGNAQLEMVRAQLYMEIGDMQTADGILERLAATAEKQGYVEWASTYAITRMAYGDYARAIELWLLQLHDMRKAMTEQLVRVNYQTLPFYSPATSELTSAYGWPLRQISAVEALLISVPNQSASLQFQIGLARLESGDSEGAGEILTIALEAAPDSPMWMLTATYLNLITGEPISRPDPYTWFSLDDDDNPVPDNPKPDPGTTKKSAPKPIEPPKNDGVKSGN
ncbi:MAG: hypothetical protein O3A00_04370 [Planctomycetota bacterium]|nr:hypothetical protein [Planctomycetota bacterium]